MSDDIPVSDNFEPVPGVKYEDEPAAQPEAPSAVTAPEPTEPPKAEPEPPVEPAKPEAVAEPVKERPQKATPIQNLLEKKHEAEARAEAAEARATEAELKLQKIATQPESPQSDGDIKALADEYGIDEALLARIVSTARKGISPELPKEVQDLIAEREEQKVRDQEVTSFNKRVDALAKALPTEQFSDPKVKDKLLLLAYSTEKASDGEPYYQKELSELYFAYVKPEIEPGTTSAEGSHGGSQSTQVMDFQEILDRDNPKDIEAMDSETFNAFNKWANEKGGKTPIQRTN